MFRLYFTTFTLVMFLGAILAFAQGSSLENIEEVASKDEKSLAFKNTRLSTEIAEYLQSYRGALSPSMLDRQQALSRGLHIDSMGRLQVTVELYDFNHKIINTIERLGGHVERKNLMRKRIQAGLPVWQIEAFSKLPEVKFVRLPDYYIQNQGSVKTESDAVIRADKARQEFGLTGKGVKVGILSLGFIGWENSSIRTGDLPDRSKITLSPFRGDGKVDKEGDGALLMEIIYDIAPGVSFFGAAVQTVDEFLDAVDWLMNQKCQIIATDLGIFNNGPYDGTSDDAQKVTEAVQKGVPFFVPIGNGAQRHYQGTFSDADGDGAHNFLPDDDGLSITLSPYGTVGIYLQWDDGWGYSGNDYDLILVDWGAKKEIASSSRVQDGDDDPVEQIIFTDLSGRKRNLAIFIEKNVGAQVKNLNLFVSSDDIQEPIEHNVPEGSIANPACAKDALSIGAVWWKTPDTIEPYSSHGPTVDGGLKPDLVAPTGVSTTQIPTGFFGTSAATPHAAAVAALILECRPAFKPSNISETLTSTAVDLGQRGQDNIYGYGRVDAYEAIKTVAGKPDLTLYKPSGWSDKIVVSKRIGDNTDDLALTIDDTLYVDWAVINQGNADIDKRFYYYLYVDSTKVHEWYSDNLKVGYNARIEDYSIGKLGTGMHTIKIVADATMVVDELDENNNEFTKSISISHQVLYEYTSQLSKGINWFSMPLDPSKAPGGNRWKISDLVAYIGDVQYVISQGKEAGEFLVWMPILGENHPANVFVEGDKGYIISLNKAKTVTFKGSGWGNLIKPAPDANLARIQSKNENWAFVVFGTIQEPMNIEESELEIVVTNLHTKESYKTRISDSAGFFAVPLVHLNQIPVVFEEDEIEITIVDVVSNISILEPIRYKVQARHLDETMLKIELPVLVQSKLFQNYPNPFNPETWIPFALAEPADVTIRIYNITGQLVKELPLGRRQAGLHLSRDKAAYWDGRNAFGERVSSGVYFYTINAENFTANRKMVIMK